MELGNKAQKYTIMGRLHKSTKTQEDINRQNNQSLNTEHMDAIGKEHQ